MYKSERMSRYILNEVETSHHLIRLYFILTILITEDDNNHIFFFGVSVSTVDRALNSTWVDLITFHLN
jgi:hypothetical protein